MDLFSTEIPVVMRTRCLVKRCDSYSNKPVQEVMETLTFKEENVTCICQMLREELVIPFGCHQFRPVNVSNGPAFTIKHCNHEAILRKRKGLP